MPAVGEVVGELYMEGSNGQQQPLSPSMPPPPEAPSSIPAPPVVIAKPRKMMDQNADGTIRDTSSEALRDGNGLQFQGTDPEPKEEPASTAPPTQEPIAAPPAPAPEPPKLYAGKYKTPEDMEKAYNEANAALTKANQKAAELERKATVQAATPPATALSVEEQKNELLKNLVENPNKVLSEIARREIQNTTVAVQSNQAAMEWRNANKDIADLEPYFLVDVQRIAGENPDLAANPAALLAEATTRFRQSIGRLRTDAAREALTTESRVIPLLQNTSAPPDATEHPSQKAPLTPDAAHDAHMRFLKAEERRSHRGLRP